jgi:hypothetical protein
MYNLLYSMLSSVISQISTNISRYAHILSYQGFGIFWIKIQNSQQDPDPLDKTDTHQEKMYANFT